MAKSRNRGMEEANGEFFAVLDCDDIWIQKDKISKQIDFLVGNLDHGVI